MADTLHVSRSGSEDMAHEGCDQSLLRSFSYVCKYHTSPACGSQLREHIYVTVGTERHRRHNHTKEQEKMSLQVEGNEARVFNLDYVYSTPVCCFRYSKTELG
eukprot:Blabericola_migrator_1__1968@NODE_1537_length_4324_cov_94_076110_g1010_i0_p7_GENE_NODE_1537_length_4324_cov_94_076110_g1010_i0NODE_1537_length_4324_cov_94_076110_g1010_i0_p7_ORF_typecomplete_len103_score4_18Insulin/PF00049_18/6_8e02Insulin/PF00049_18/0_42_NODE_1537_length_4324_cov_94_076110_g1010_i036503958